MDLQPITAAVGLNGDGKTLCMVEKLVLPSLALGRPVLSNVRIFASPDDAHLPSDERETHPLWEPLTNPGQLLGVVDATVLLDEIQGAFGSREWGKMPAQVVHDIKQLRKDDNILGWTAPSWEDADVAIRRITLELVLCTGHLGKRVPGKLWKSNRLFRYRFFDGRGFEEFSLASAKSTQQGTLRPARREWYLRSRHQAHLMYDTRQHVEPFEHLDQYGNCSRCGGTRKRPACSCPPRDEMAAAAQASRSGAGAAGAVHPSGAAAG